MERYWQLKKDRFWLSMQEETAIPAAWDPTTDFCGKAWETEQ